MGARLFKRGLESVSSDYFGTKTPAFGLRLAERAETYAGSTLRKGHVIVVVDGVPVDNLEANYLLVGFKCERGKPVRITFWDGAAYREWDGLLPLRRIGVCFEGL